jgi:hypothetical protein
MVNNIQQWVGKHRFMRWWDCASNSASVVIKVTYFKPFYDDGNSRFVGDEG